MKITDKVIKNAFSIKELINKMRIAFTTMLVINVLISALLRIGLKIPEILVNYYLSYNLYIGYGYILSFIVFIVYLKYYGFNIAESFTSHYLSYNIKEKLCEGEKE